MKYQTQCKRCKQPFQGCGVFEDYCSEYCQIAADLLYTVKRCEGLEIENRGLRQDKRELLKELANVKRKRK